MKSLYKTATDEIKVLEKQVEILIKHAMFRTCPPIISKNNNCPQYQSICQSCWAEWSLKEAKKEG